MSERVAHRTLKPSRAPEDLEALEIELLLTAVMRRYGYDFRKYAPASLKRRVRRARLMEELPTISALQERLLHCPDALQRFISSLSVHVTAMFRDPPFYQALRRTVVPLLRTYPFVRIWQAGCSTGEEAYSLAILLFEEGLYDRCRIYATDLSDSLLDRARAGRFSLRDMREYTTNYLKSGGRGEFSSFYTADQETAHMRDALKSNLVFAHHNLVSDSAFNEFHLILCRNVMLYFDFDLRERVYQLLHQSLVRLGVLGLGMRETLRYSPFAADYQALNDNVRLYRRTR